MAEQAAAASAQTSRPSSSIPTEISTNDLLDPNLGADHITANIAVPGVTMTGTADDDDNDDDNDEDSRHSSQPSDDSRLVKHVPV